MKYLKLISAIFALIVCGNVTAKPKIVEPVINAILNGSIEGLSPNDSLILYIWDDGIIDEGAPAYYPHREMIIAHQQGSFRFDIEGLNGLTYISLCKKGYNLMGFPIPMLKFFLLAPGDQVSLKATKKPNATVNKTLMMDSGLPLLNNEYDFTFYGKQAKRFECNWIINKEIESLELHRYIHKNLQYGIGQLSMLAQTFSLLNKINEKCSDILSNYRSEMDEESYKLMYAHLFGTTESFKFEQYRRYVAFEENDTLKRELRKFVQQHYDSLKATNLRLLDPQNIASPLFRKFLYDKYNFYQTPSINKEGKLSINTLLSVYNKVKNDVVGNGKDLLLTKIVLNVLRFQNNDSLVLVAQSDIKSRMCKSVIENTQRITKIGAKGASFRLPDEEGKYHSLTDFAGKVVFFDFWFSGCSGCKSYYKNVLSVVEEKYKEHPEVVFITISIDGTKELWRKGLRSGGYTSDHAINLYTDGRGVSHPVIKDYNVYGYPSPILLDKAGKIVANSYLALNTKEKLIANIEAALAK